MAWVCVALRLVLSVELEVSTCVMCLCICGLGVRVDSVVGCLFGLRLSSVLSMWLVLC